jgi:vacuolar-type H+-ATPase subunit D/Vma8
MEKLIENEVLQCKLQSDKKWAKIEVELQKIQDDIKAITEDKIPVIEARLNKQAGMVSEIQQVSLNVASLSQNMQSMLDELKKQNDRLNSLEQKPVKRYEGIVDTIVKLVVTAAVGALLLKIGLTT